MLTWLYAVIGGKQRKFKLLIPKFFSVLTLAIIITIFGLTLMSFRTTYAQPEKGLKINRKNTIFC